ncbi:hypothetical protein HanPI659440_Chr14g0553411 [Helianthus annuus]|nr:hypothetical protein HanPI659440_Chr14g0553411 [Helianthus annuus]
MNLDTIANQTPNTSIRKFQSLPKHEPRECYKLNDGYMLYFTTQPQSFAHHCRTTGALPERTDTPPGFEVSPEKPSTAPEFEASLEFGDIAGETRSRRDRRESLLLRDRVIVSCPLIGFSQSLLVRIYKNRNAITVD